MSVIDPSLRFPQCRPVLTHDEILAELRAQVAAKKFKQNALAAFLGIAPARVAEMLTGKRLIQQHEMPQLAEWLRMVEAPLPEVIEGAEPVVAVPLLGSVPGGNWREAVQSAKGRILVAKSDAPKDAYALTVEGDSMDLHVQSGSTIIIDPNDHDLFAGRLYVVANAEDEATFKQYLDNPARLVPCSSNPEHKEIPLGEGGYRVVGRVVTSTKRH